MGKTRHGREHRVITYYKKELELSDETIANLLGITVNTWSKFKANPIDRSMSELFHLAGIFGISIYQLMHLILQHKALLRQKAEWFINDELVLSSIVVDKIKDLGE